MDVKLVEYDRGDMLKFKYMQVNNKLQYSSKRRSSKDIIAIVFHDTGNTGKGAGALNHQKYLTHATRSGSAHYYVDDNYIVQPIGDSYIAYSVGDKHSLKNRTRSDLNNSNTISVELCINSDGNYKQAYTNSVELVKNLMVKFNIPINNVVRHFDVSGKMCPNTMSKDNWKDWYKFKEDVSKPIQYMIDLEKDSEFGGVCNACGRPYI